MLDFLVIGAKKSGTTSLWRHLDSHPDVRTPSDKESAFFTSEHLYAQGLQRFVGKWIGPVPAGARCGTVSPTYMAASDEQNAVTAERIRRQLPEVRLIAILRDPIERLVSHYRHALRAGNLDDVGIEQAIERDMQARPSPVPIVRRGLYGQTLSHYGERFPREQLRVVYTQDLESDPEALLRDLFAFIGVDPTHDPPALGERHLAGGNRQRVTRAAFDELKTLLAVDLWAQIEDPRRELRRRVEWRLTHVWNVEPDDDRPAIAAATRERLEQLYARDAELLAEITGAPVPWLARYASGADAEPPAPALSSPPSVQEPAATLHPPAQEDEPEATLAVAFEATGVVFSNATPRAYAVLGGDEAFLLNSGALGGSGLEGTSTPVLEPVPPPLHAAIEGQHRHRRLSFPEVAPGAGFVATQRGLADLRLVDPTSIELVYGGTEPKQLLRSQGMVLDGDWDTPHRQRFGELDVTRSLREALVDGRPWESTDLYARALRSIESGTPMWGCTSEQGFRERLAGLERLFEDMRSNGYRTQAELGSDDLADEVRVGIRRDGQILFIDGRHRLAMARILGIERIPVNVVVRHQEWARFRHVITDYIGPRNGRVYQAIDHPDLSDFPAHHGPERLGMLREAFAGYDCRDKRLLDIGAHWGAMSQEAARLGFRCTAVEANKRCARIAERLSTATGAGFDVWHGSIFDFPDVERQQAVLALNIFHHFTKTEALHEQLVELLGRMRAEIMVFEPHASDPPGQMRGAFRNYPEQEFVELVATHGGFSSSTYLGRAKDGRALYRLTRS